MGLRLEHLLVGSSGALLFLIGCSGSSVLEPVHDASLEGDLPFAAVAAVEEVCATIDFESLAHGDAVTLLAVPELELEFNVSVWPANGGLASARVYSTDTMSPPGDPFLAWSGEDSACPECLGIGNVLVVEDGAGFDAGGASDFGGTFFLDGFSQQDVRIRGLTAVGAGSFNESHLMLIDAEPIVSSVAAAGAVQPLTPSAEPVIQSFVELVVLSSARGGFDDLLLCRMMEVVEEPGGSDGGGEGCGFSYWRNAAHGDSWLSTGLSPELGILEVLGDVPEALARPEHELEPAGLTLGQALHLRGSGVNRLLRETGAAILNATSSGVSYDLAPGEVEQIYAAAIAGGNEMEAARTFSQLNNQVCPLD
ncbi:MAG: hypothetical protein ACWGON_07565, partial [Gemmatimonadota bacterium]